VAIGLTTPKACATRPGSSWGDMRPSPSIMGRCHRDGP
jgi:hypothetical protein